MGFWDFFHNRYKFPVHIVQLILIVAAMGLSVPRLFMKNQPRTRANTIALGMVGIWFSCKEATMLMLAQGSQITNLHRLSAGM